MSILNGLENPWDMAFTKNGDMFFTEKCKGLSVKTKSGSVIKLAGMKGAKGYASSNSDLFCSGQAGMMGVAVDPNFKKNRRICMKSTSNKYHGSGCKTNFDKCDGNIIMRMEVSKDMKSVSNRVDIVKDIQYKPLNQITLSVVQAHITVTDYVLVLKDTFGLQLVTVIKVMFHNLQNY